MQSASAAMSATLLATGAQAPMEVEQGEEEMETGEVAKVSRHTLEELAMAVGGTPTPTPIPTTPSSLLDTPIPIYSAVMTALGLLQSQFIRWC